jgi:hypothetical protein
MVDGQMVIRISGMLAVSALAIHPAIASAAEILLACEGKAYGRGFSDSYYNFTLNLKSDTGEMYGYPNYIIPGCMPIGPEKTKIDIFVSQSEYKLTCTSRLFGSIASLNRYTKILNVTNFFTQQKDFRAHYGRYICKIAGNRAF